MSTTAISKLLEARRRADDFQRATTADGLSDNFHACLSSLYSTKDVLEKDTKRRLRSESGRPKAASFDAWWVAKEREMKRDKLITWLFDKRNGSVHDGSSPLNFYYRGDIFLGADIEPCTVPGADLFLGMNGPEWVVEMGTARERRWQAAVKPGTPTALSRDVIGVSVQKPPRTHAGHDIKVDPLSLMLGGISYFEQLIDDVMSQYA